MLCNILQVHVGWLEGGTAILAFRGTQTAQDGLQDVKIVRQSIDHLQGMFPGTQAHSGLYLWHQSLVYFVHSHQQGRVLTLQLNLLTCVVDVHWC